MNIALMNEKVIFQKCSVVKDGIGNHRNEWTEDYSCFATIVKLKMMRQEMWLEMLPGMRMLEVRIMLLEEQMQNPGVVRRFLWM